jgi:hypothetical protein
MVIEHMTHWTRLALKEQRILLIFLQRGTKVQLYLG